MHAIVNVVNCLGTEVAFFAPAPKFYNGRTLGQGTEGVNTFIHAWCPTLV